MAGSSTIVASRLFVRGVLDTNSIAAALATAIVTDVGELEFASTAGVGELVQVAAQPQRTFAHDAIAQVRRLALETSLTDRVFAGDVNEWADEIDLGPMET